MISLKRIKNTAAEHFTDIVLFLILLAIGIKYTYNLQSFYDITLNDDTVYLNNGIRLLSLGLPSPQWGPVYSIWHFLFSLLEHDSIRLFYLNVRMLMIFVPLSFFVFLRIRGITNLLSFLTGYFILIINGNLLTFPKVSHFLIITIISSFILLSIIKKKKLGWYIIIYSSLLTAYIRPEFSVSFIIFLFIFLINKIKTKTFMKDKIEIFGSILVIFFTILILGNPLSNDGRAFLAFGQHFSANWVVWNQSSLYSWADFNEIVQKEFGNANNIWEAFINNKEQFVKHIITNISLIYPSSTDLFRYTILSNNHYKFQHKEFYLLIFLTLITWVFYLYKGKLSIIEAFKKNFRNNKNYFLISIVYLIPVIISIIIIYPRQHYLLILFSLLVVSFLLLFNVSEKSTIHFNSIKSITMVGISIFLFIITPNSAKYFKVYNQNNLNTVKYLRALNINSKVNILEANGGLYSYLDDNYVNVPLILKDDSFDKFLAEREINMIIYNGKLANRTTIRTDSSWHYFLKNYKQFNFTKEIIPNSGNEIFIKKRH